MRIGLNAISFAPGAMGGMETYFRNLLQHLQELDHANQYLILCDRRHEGEFQLSNEQFRLRHVNYAKPSLKWLVRGLLRNTVNIDMLVAEMRGLPVDLIHHPFTVVTPPGIKVPSVLTFWDMQHEFYPEFFAPLDLRKRRRLYRLSAEEATHVIVSADFTKQCLMERYDIPAEKITTIYTGIGKEYQVLDDPVGLAALREKYGLNRPFLYYPAATWPHKNHRTLLAAFRLLIDRCQFDGDLVLTGIAMRANDEVLTEIERLGLSERVKVLGYLPYAELPALYNLAEMLVFPSLFEGFGIPVVEAMACGCPVICANATSLPEVVGDAGLLFEPLAVEELAEAIRSVWDDAGRQQEMRRRGLARAQLFNWAETARQTLAVYQSVGSGA